MTLPVEVNPTLMYKSGGGYQIPRSLRFRASAPNYLTRLPSSAGNQQKWTLSFWVKRGKLANYNIMFNNNAYSGTYIAFGGAVADTLMIGDYGSSYNYQLVSTQVFRDTSAWYHFVIAFDTTQATASNRLKVYCNGSQITSFQTANYPTLNYNTYWNQTSTHYIGQASDGSPFDGYMTEINFVNGQQLDQTSFGETDTTTGVWKPKKYTGSYGTNGFYLNFSDNSAATAAAIGKDSSGNGNNWTPNNISLTAGATYDSMIDTPTPYDDGGNGRGNYPVANPLWKAATIYIDDGNLRLQPTGSGVGAGWRSNFPMPSSTGKWYYEVTVQTVGAGSQLNHVAIGDQFYAFDLSSGSFYYYRSDGNISGTTGYATFSNGSIIGVALDTVAATLSFYHNGTLQRTITSVGISTDWWPGGLIPAGAGAVSHVNFGQRPFAYTPPSGFKALNTQNLPVPTIVKPSTAFNTVLYTGNGSTQTISGLGFSPDLVWIKSRSFAEDHALFDTVRGSGKYVKSNATSTEFNLSSTLNTFNSDGFTLGSAAITNTSSATYAAWAWDEGATPGFDVVTYTGTGVNRTVAHNLGVAPAMMIIKNRDSAQNWVVYHKNSNATPQNYILRLNTTDAALASSGSFNNTAPTSTEFTVGTLPALNGSGNNMLAYLWAEVPGFSKFGSYTGNGSADGPFVYCGFRPKFLILKNATTGGSAYDWFVYDSVRDQYNAASLLLTANYSGAETVRSNGVSTPTQYFDLLSNGFKVRTSGTGINASGNVSVFAAFAENPFKYALAR